MDFFSTSFSCRENNALAALFSNSNADYLVDGELEEIKFLLTSNFEENKKIMQCKEFQNVPILLEKKLKNMSLCLHIMQDVTFIIGNYKLLNKFGACMEDYNKNSFGHCIDKYRCLQHSILNALDGESLENLKHYIKSNYSEAFVDPYPKFIHDLKVFIHLECLSLVRYADADKLMDIIFPIVSDNDVKRNLHELYNLYKNCSVNDQTNMASSSTNGNDDSLTFDAKSGGRPQNILDQSMGDPTCDPVFATEEGGVISMDYGQTYYLPSDSLKSGKCIILNIQEYSDPQDYRHGSEHDVKSLTDTFQSLNFEVQMYGPKLLKIHIDQILNEVALSDESKSWHIFACCILSHGACDVILDSVKTPVRIIDLLTKFNHSNAPNLIGKPKLFFIQACQEESFPDPLHHPVMQSAGAPCADASSSSCAYRGAHQLWENIADCSDIFRGMSTVPLKKSLRNIKKGSWYIQTLCKRLNQLNSQSDSIHLLDLHTEINNEISKMRHVTKTGQVLEQMCCFNSSLRYKLYFVCRTELPDSPAHASGDDPPRSDSLDENKISTDSRQTRHEIVPSPRRRRHWYNWLLCVRNNTR